MNSTEERKKYQELQGRNSKSYIKVGLSEEQQIHLHIIQTLKNNNCYLRLLYSEKLSVKTEEGKTCCVRNRLKEFMTTKLENTERNP